MEIDQGGVEFGFLVGVKSETPLPQYKDPDKIRKDIEDSLRFGYPLANIDVTYIGEIKDETENG